MYYFVYKTINKLNNKIYIGIHRTTKLDDGYLGSGKFLRQAIKRYGKKNFSREILFFGENYEQISLKEKELVTSEFCKRRDTYNTELGGKGGKIWTNELKKKMSKSVKLGYKNGRINPFLGKKVGDRLSPEGRKKVKERMTGKNNPMFGKRCEDVLSSRKEEQRRKNISVANRKPKSNKEKYSIVAKQRIWLISKDGVLSSTLDKNDKRLNSLDWQRGRKWK